MRRAVEVQGRQSVPDRFLCQILGLVPKAGALVEQRQLFRLFAEQVGPKDVGEEVMVAVPFPPVVEGDDEEVGALQCREHAASIVAAGDSVAQWPGEPVENRRVQQEAANRVRLVFQHLLDQVVDDVAVVPGEPGNETGGVVAPLEGERSELKGGNPSLRSLSQSRHFLRGQAQPRHPVEIGGCLLGRKAQLRGTDLDELSANPPAGQWQIRVGARADHDVNVWRKVAQQDGHPVANVAVVHHVVVIEHQPNRARGSGELVEHGGEHKIGREGCLRRREELQRGSPDAGHRRLERGHDAGPEGGRIVVRRIEREPGDETVFAGRRTQPVCKERRLAESCGCGQQGQSRLRPVTQALAESRACHKWTPQLWDIQLGCNHRTCHGTSFQRAQPHPTGATTKASSQGRRRLGMPVSSVHGLVASAHSSVHWTKHCRSRATEPRRNQAAREPDSELATGPRAVTTEPFRSNSSVSSGSCQ